MVTVRGGGREIVHAVRVVGQGQRERPGTHVGTRLRDGLAGHLRNDGFTLQDSRAWHGSGSSRQTTSAARSIPARSRLCRAWDEAGENGGELLETIALATLAGAAVPAQRWIVPGLIPDRNVTDLSGDGGTGKTLLALQLCVAVATATDWIGLGVPDTTGTVLYVSCEEEIDEIHRRINNIVAGSGLSIGDLKHFHVADLTVAASTDLARGEHGSLALTALYETLARTLARLRPKLVVLDTRADVYGANENDRGLVRSLVQALRRQCLSSDLAVLLLSHPSLTGINSGTGQSGSTGWGNSVRSRLYLHRQRLTTAASRTLTAVC